MRAFTAYTTRTEVRLIGFEVAAEGRILLTFFEKLFSQLKKDLIGAAKRNAGHLCRTSGRPVQCKTTQKETNSGLRNLQKMKIAIYSSHCSSLTHSERSVSS
jgi:hypothetical protein